MMASGSIDLEEGDGNGNSYKREPKMACSSVETKSAQQAVDMKITYWNAIKKSTNEKQLLFMMVMASEEVGWCSVWSAVEKEDDYCRRNSFAEVKDRSLSYLDINFPEKFPKKKAFESVKKFGRPRQQISDCLNFLDPPLSVGSRGDIKENYHFGHHCLILPKVSTLHLKENANPHKNRPRDSIKARQIHHGSERNEQKYPNGMFFTISEKVTIPSESDYEFENKMYQWAEVISEKHQKKLFKSSIEEKRNVPFRVERLGSRRNIGDFYNEDEEDLEAQIDSRYRKDLGKSEDLKDEFYYDETFRRQSRSRDVAESSTLESRISRIRENCRMKEMQEFERKSTKAKVEERKSGAKSDIEEDEVWVQPIVKKNWVGSEEIEKKELHRSQSTPDMLEGIGRRRLEVWTQQEEEPRRNGSVMEVCVRNWEVYNDQQEADSLNDPNSLQEPVSSPELSGGEKVSNSKFVTGKNFFGEFLNSGGTTPTEMFSNTEPFSQFWVSLSNIYGQALVILMLAFSLTEVMDNSVKLLSLQGIFLIYLYVGSIAVIICIYIWVLIDSCSSLQKNDSSGLMPPTISTSIVQDRDAELQNLSATRFGSLKKAHISRDRTSNTSFYLRIGAIAFGLGTLVFNGLEMAMHTMMESSCLNDIFLVHPILHGLFTFLQMHFLFVNSQVLVERFGLAARFGFMHLAATNLSLWIKLVIWESGNEWTYYVHLSQYETNHHSNDIPTPLQLRGFPKFIIRKDRELDFGTSENGFYQAISKDHISQVVSLHQCLNTNSLGQLWTSSMPFLYPFIIQFSLIAAAVTYIMGQNVAKDRLFFQKQKKVGTSDSNHKLTAIHNGVNTWSVDCGGASKGLFLGILCLVAGVVVIIIFLVVKENEDFPPETIFWLTMGMLLTILSVTVLMNIAGIVQIRKLSVIGNKMTPLDKILSTVSVLGVQLYTILGIVVGGSGMVEESREGFSSPMQKRHMMLLAVSLIQLLQTIMQSTFIVEGIRRTSLSRTQVLTRPGRQVVTFLVFSNAVLWAFDTFVIQNWMSQELQLRFYGVLAWGALSRIGLPLLVFFRFHSCVLLLEIWKKSFHSLHLDPGN